MHCHDIGITMHIVFIQTGDLISNEDGDGVR